MFDMIKRVPVEFPKDIKLSPEVKNLITRLTEKDPMKRLGWNGPLAIKHHPWFKSINWIRLKNRSDLPPLELLTEEDPSSIMKESLIGWDLID